MDKKTRGMLLGIVGVILWFMPLAYVNMHAFGGQFAGLKMYQSGFHVGGIAYVLVLSLGSYAYNSWTNNRKLSIISSSISLGISLLFLLQAGSNAAWGLLSIVVISIASLLVALKLPKLNLLE